MELWFFDRSQFHLLRTSGASNEYNATTEIGSTKVEMTWYIPTFILDYAKNKLSAQSPIGICTHVRSME